MTTRRKISKIGGSDNGMLSSGQIVTVVIGYPDGGSETIHQGAVVDANGTLLKIKKDDRETVVNTASYYFIKAEIENTRIDDATLSDATT